jgi:hypothetical protein
MADPAGKLAYDDSGRLVFNTFRNKGVPLADDVGYAEWMLRTDMPLSTKRVIRQELERINSEQANLFDEFSPAVAEGGPF